MTNSDDISFSRLVTWENLWLAYQKASRGKRSRESTAQFDFRLADNLCQLRQDLMSGAYRPGNYYHFYIHEPKRRLISAAPFRDRVVHHALCQIIEPVFERRFYTHSYANRVGKGTHRAIAQVQQFAGRFKYFLRLDIKQHFASIDHQILQRELFRYVDDPQLHSLISLILSSGAGVLKHEYEMVCFPGDDEAARYRPRGLPIGNLTSQFWSNCYLNPLDWFIVRELSCSAYCRYVDDMVLFSNSKADLHGWKRRIQQFLIKLRLTIHKSKGQVFPVKQGVPWLGFVVYPQKRLVKRRNVIKFCRNYRRNIGLYQEGELTFLELDARVQGWINHVKGADSWGIREHIFERQLILPPE